MFEAIGISKAHGARKIFGPLDIRINPADRLALVGANGSGKSTILKILAGQEHSDSGEIRCKKGLSVGYLPQEAEAEGQGNLLSFVEDAAGEVKEVREALGAAQAMLDGGDSSPETLARFGTLQERFMQLGGYRLRSEAKRLLVGLGFAQEDFGRELASFSGGWRMRALLARILLKNPDVVLLDEPTNHLDIVTLVWLEEFISNSPSAFLIVSHDVSFLDRMVEGVIALENTQAVRTKGNYTQYVASRGERRELLQSAWERKQRQFAEERKFIERFRAKNTKAAQVQSRIKRLEKEEEEVSAPEASTVRRPTITFPQPERSGHEVVKLDHVSAGYGEKLVYTDLSFTLYRGRKVVLIGPNGAGKSTMMKLMAGVLKPASGTASLGSNVSVSYFSQHQMELLNPRRTVLEEIICLPGLRSEREARTLLGAFLFSGDDVEKPVSVLSGGEKSRLVLARIMTQPGNLLLMDEPTNHLDIESCEVLKKALEDYQGTLAVITHDRDLITRVADTILYVEKAAVTEYLGGFDAFQRLKAKALNDSEEKRAQEAEEAKGGLSAAKGKDARRREAERREKIRKVTAPLKARVESLESSVDSSQVRIDEINEFLAKPEIYGDPARAADLSRELKTLQDSMDGLMLEWEAAAGELHRVTEDIAAGED